MEKRTNERAVFHTVAIIKYNGIETKCDIKNLSIKGLFALCSCELDIGKNVDVAILLSGTSSEVRLNLKGEVVRVEEEGIAIAFSEIELDSYSILKNIINYSPKD